MSGILDQAFEPAHRAIEKLAEVASPAALRNSVPIAKALASHLPGTGLVVEVAAGAGVHAAVMAAQFPYLDWQPTDLEPHAIAITAQVVKHLGLENLKPAVKLDVCSEPWPILNASAILCCNMIHIAPWSAAEGLMKGARQLLPPEALLFLYGPFSVNGQHTAPSNKTFDVSLRRRDGSWGVRDTRDVDMLAHRHRLAFESHIDMPANNMIRIYRRES